jgi:hypothetical protein
MKYVIPTIIALCTSAAYGQEQPVKDTTRKDRQLKEVSITAQKNAVEIVPGKTIVNVQALAGTSGKTVLDVLRRVPGVSVDGKGNITMTGRQGVLVTIDGRQTYLSGEELRDYLQGMTAEETAQIEVMSQPPAQYDAEGNSGVINIKTRKLKRQGLNGNATLTWTKSLFENANNTVLLNYRGGKTNWHTSLNNINGMNGVWWYQDTYFDNPTGGTLAHTAMQSVPVEWLDKYNVRTGADCNYSDKTNLGFSVSGAYYANRMHSLINTQYDNPVTSTNSIRNTYEHSLRKNATANAYLKQTPSKQSELNINLDYLLYTKRLYQSLATEAYENGISLPDQLVLQSRVPINIVIYSGRTDYSTTLSNGIKVETGLKHSYVNVDNAAYFMQYTANSWIDDGSRTNRFLYFEHISAAYANATGKLGVKWEAQAGLRGEIANISALQEATGERLDRHLPALFPSAYLAYRPDSVNSLELNYSRRVERPHYSMLNPFNYYTFYNTYQRGNPMLLPQYTHNVELKHSYKNHWITSLQLSAINNTLSYISVPDYRTQSIYGMPVNFKTNGLAYLSVTYNNKPLPWWELSACTGGRYALYRGLYGNQTVQQEGWGYSAWFSSRMEMGKWEADCYAQYLGGMVTSPVSKDGPTLYTNLGVSKRMLRDTTTVKVSVDDPFYIYRSKSYNNQPGLMDTSTLRSNSRYCTLVVTYKFGLNGERREQSRTDEAGRVGM